MWTYLHGGLTTVGQQGLRMAAIIRERLYKREQMGERSRLWRETRRGLSRWSEAGRSRLLVTIFNTWGTVMMVAMRSVHLSKADKEEDKGKFDKSKQLG